MSLWQELREPGQEPTVDEEPLPPPPTAETPLPHADARPAWNPNTAQETSHV